MNACSYFESSPNSQTRLRKSPELTMLKAQWLNCSKTECHIWERRWLGEGGHVPLVIVRPDVPYPLNCHVKQGQETLGADLDMGYMQEGQGTVSVTGSELRSCVKVEVAIPNKPTVSVEVAIPYKPMFLWRWLSLISLRFLWRWLSLINLCFYGGGYP